MNANRPTEPAAGLSLGDIYYVVFRHKWKIILLTLAGFAAAVAVYFFHPPPYQSQAELLIKYVPESAQLSLGADSQKVIIPDSRGQDIINSEIQILTSLNIAQEAANNLGASNLLGQTAGKANPVAAAFMIQGHLKAAPAENGSSVIVVTFKHSNPAIVQPVLDEVINDYFKKHFEIHSEAGQYDDALTREQSRLKVQLNATEQQLADIKNKANIISLDDSRKNLADQIAKVRSARLDAQAELSGYESAMKQADAGSSTNLAATNLDSQLVIPPDQMDAFTDIRARLDALHKKAQSYSLQGYTSSNSLIQEVSQQIAGEEKTRAALEQKYPQIAGLASVTPSTTGSSTAPITDVRAQYAQVAALQAKIKAWGTQLDQLLMQATNLNNLAPTISQLEQTMSIQQANYQNLSVSLEKSHIDEALDTGKSPNIKWVQTPSPPVQDWQKTHKVMAMMAIGGILAGLALAFLLELYLDHSVKRAVEVETKLKIPLFLSVPDVRRNGHARRLKAPDRRQLALNHQANGDASTSNGEAQAAENDRLDVVSLEKNPALELYFEALRDRLIVDFEVKGLTHKPKLVAVTSAGRGAGASTLAAGLAASFSTTGDGHVLLVDMTWVPGSAQHFHQGKAGCNLDSALKKETKEDALVQENLYVVSENSGNGNLQRVLPRRFASLMPKFEASNFDYIIFDLPPVSQTSVTARVARFMDNVLLVIESEHTDREAVRRASQQLAETGASVSAVLNKTHDYVPARLHQESLGDK